MNLDTTQQLDIHIHVSSEQYAFLKDWAHHMRCPIGELVVACAMQQLAAEAWDISEKAAVVTEEVLEALRRFIDRRETPDSAVAFDQ
ncbi:MAG: hypothetical protein PHF70_09795 [Opitutales bacterium]|nr:hypothetical protein [Opitutales bacterium]